MNDEMTGSEALYGFAGWLTTRDESVTAGATHDASCWAHLVAEFCEVNNLQEPRHNWSENLKHPSSGV